MKPLSELGFIEIDMPRYWGMIGERCVIGGIIRSYTLTLGGYKYHQYYQKEIRGVCVTFSAQGSCQQCREGGAYTHQFPGAKIVWNTF